MRKVIDLELKNFNNVLLLNRVMCNVAEYIQRVRANLDARYTNGEISKLVLEGLPFHFLSSETATPGSNTHPRSNMPPQQPQHAPGDIEHARLAGLASMCVIKVRVSCVRGDVLQCKS